MNKESVVRKILELPRHAWGHWLGIVGIILTTVFGVLTVGVFLAELAGFHAGPYSGLVTFFLVPAGFVGSLVLIAVGGWLSARRQRKHGREGTELPVIDFNLKGTRRIVLTVAVLTIVNLLIVGTATYKGTANTAQTKDTIVGASQTQYLCLYLLGLSPRRDSRGPRAMSRSWSCLLSFRYLFHKVRLAMRRPMVCTILPCS
jgi:MFS family permease